MAEAGGIVPTPAVVSFSPPPKQPNTGWRTALILVGSGLLSLAGSSLSNYLQTRGFVSVELARLFLAITWVAGAVLIVICVMAFGLRRRLLTIGFGVFVLTGTLLGLELWVTRSSKENVAAFSSRIQPKPLTPMTFWADSANKVWTEHDNGFDLNYWEAESYCNEFNHTRTQGFVDWRLPTIAELRTLYEPNQHYEAHEPSGNNGDVYINHAILLTGFHVWSSIGTGHEGTATWWSFYYRRENMAELKQTKDHLRALCIHAL